MLLTYSLATETVGRGVYGSEKGDVQVWILPGSRAATFAVIAATRVCDAPMRYSLSMCDVHSDGTVVHGDPLNNSFVLDMLFPPLISTDGSTYSRAARSFSVSQRSVDTLDIRVTSPLYQLSSVTERSTLTLSDDHMPLSVSTTTARREGFVNQSTTVCRLQSVSEATPASLVKLRREATICLSALARYESVLMLDRASRASEARAVLLDAHRSVALPVVLRQLEAALESHGDRVKAVQHAARQEAALRGLNVAWVATDLSGRRHELGAYRGKIVVLDFWFRGCGPCIELMTQIRDHVVREPGVVMLGVTHDREAEDAEAVAQALKLTDPVLFKSDIAAAYGVRAWPTVLILDGDGRVDDARVGYSSAIAEWINDRVARLRR